MCRYTAKHCENVPACHLLIEHTDRYEHGYQRQQFDDALDVFSVPDKETESKVETAYIVELSKSVKEGLALLP